MRKARAIEKLNKQLRPLPLPKVPKTVNKRQRLLAVLEICSCSSEVTNLDFTCMWQPGGMPSLCLEAPEQTGAAM